MIALIDYKAGNIGSVQNALERLGAKSVVTNDLSQIVAARAVIFPGQGRAGPAMQELRKLGLDKLIPTLTQPFLGICLGMQLLAETSEEDKTITEQFHDLQERLDYYDGLIWSYSKSLGWSYRKLVKKVRKTSLPLIREAWQNKPIPPQDYEPSKLKNPKFVSSYHFLQQLVSALFKADGISCWTHS